MSPSEDRLRIECSTVGELIAVLQGLPPETIPFSYEHPPFTGCLVIQQNDGKVMIAGPDKPVGTGTHCKARSPSSDRMAVGEQGEHAA
jgi:hypothetical protein